LRRGGGGCRFGRDVLAKGVHQADGLVSRPPSWDFKFSMRSGARAAAAWTFATPRMGSIDPESRRGDTPRENGVGGEPGRLFRDPRRRRYAELLPRVRLGD